MNDFFSYFYDYLVFGVRLLSNMSMAKRRQLQFEVTNTGNKKLSAAQKNTENITKENT